MIELVEIDYKSNASNLIGKAVDEMLSENIDVIWVRDFSDDDVCDQISRNFYSSGSAIPRKDNVPGLMVGESHYFKNPEIYYRLCSRTKKAVELLFENTIDPIKKIYELVSKVNETNIRAARFDSQDALHTRAIAWKEKEKTNFLLEPHDDVSQVFCDRNNGWEIQEIGALVALNFYVKCEPGEGMLRVYDLKESPSLTEELDISGSGYPYPMKVLKNRPYIDIPVKTSDALFVNGAYVHGVTKSQNQRIVMNSFIGKIKNNEMIYWT